MYKFMFFALVVCAVYPDWPIEAMAAKAVQLLIAKLREQPGIPVEVMIRSELVLRETRDGKSNTQHFGMGFRAGDPLDVVGRIAGLGHISRKRTVHQVGDAVETDGGTVKRSEINGSHKGHPPSSDAMCVPSIMDGR